MTVNEVMADMRKNGIGMSPKKFNSMVDAGLLPFVTVTGIGVTGRRTQVIMRQSHKRWLKSILEG